MIKVRMGEQYQINRGQVLNLKARTFDSFQQEKPVCKVRINQNVQISELNQKRCVADPGHGDLPVIELWKNGFPMLTDAPGQQRLPNHLSKKRARTEMFGWR